MKNEKIIKLFAKVSYAFHHPIKKIQSLFAKEEGKLSISDKLKLRKAEKNSNDIRIWSDEKFNKILEKLSTYCTTYIGKNTAIELLPNNELETVTKLLNETRRSCKFNI